MVELVQEVFPRMVECHRSDDRFRCERLFFVTRPLEVTHLHPADVAALQRLGTAAGSVGDGSETKRRIYVSRRFAQRRAYDGEPELEELLRARGFDVVYLERMPLVQQMATLREADVVVGFHGAGLANIAWSKPGTRVIEVFLGEPFTDYYRNLAGLAGHRYGSLSTRAGTPEQLADAIAGLSESIDTTR
jgi:capsular polysaccharide biosynthesis protein